MASPLLPQRPANSALQEDQVKSLAVGIDLSQALTAAGRQWGKTGSGQNVFGSLFAQKTNNGQANTAYASSDPSASSASVDPLPPLQTPMALFRRDLEDRGVDASQLQVTASDRPVLEKLLLESGYKSDDVKQMLDKSSDSEGNVNLGALFALQDQYQPLAGPQFFITSEDKPLLAQVLKGLGVAEEEVNSFIDGLEQVGDRFRVTGLPELLAQAGAASGEKAGKVDRAVLGDLLGKLGLSAQEVNTLLSKAYDQEDRANPKAVLALLQAAANRQDQGMAQALKDLAQRVKTSVSTQTSSMESGQVQAQLIQTVQQIEESVRKQSARLGQELNQALEALEQGQGEGKLDELLARLLGQESAGQEGGETGGQGQEGGSAAEDFLSGLGRASQQEASFSEDLTSKATLWDEAAPGSGQGSQSGQSASQVPGQNQALGGLSARASAWSEANPTGQSREVLPGYVVRQVGQQLVQMAAREQNSLRLELKPPSLGEINLEIQVKDGVVKATMVAESAAAKQALEAGMDQLKQDLAVQGLKLEHVEITVNPDAQRQEAQAQAQDGSWRDRQAALAAGGAAAEAGETLGEGEAALLAAAMGVSTGRISVFA